MNKESKHALNDIARNLLLLESLETRNSSEDFQEQAVWSIKKALEQTYPPNASKMDNNNNPEGDTP